ncbi:TPM domain-containing protein [Paenibacillus faecalis]|uniref:TPM domain-containing protein n=1 Tax=Paenibacillus faecalis TaxID=2079532 RepID=UPI000D10E4AE|nr:TPM domain-containing protein [Paenibacillus faecalis]
MKRWGAVLVVLIFFAVYIATPAQMTSAMQATKQLIYDEANLLSQEEYDELNTLANEYSAERETDMIIFTSNNTENVDVEVMTQRFYDERAPGYDKPHGNAVILTLDMYESEDKDRALYLAGFKKAEEYLDNDRLDKIRNKITSDLSDGDYKQAFEKYIVTAHKYMGFEPEMNPDNMLFNIWFQLGTAAAIGVIAVSLMAYRSGGRVTVSRRTYEDTSTSGILEREDRYIRTTTTKRKIEQSTSSGSGGGGGGGVTGGGHSHSGSRGSF